MSKGASRKSPRSERATRKMEPPSASPEKPRMKHFGQITGMISGEIAIFVLLLASCAPCLGRSSIAGQSQASISPGTANSEISFSENQLEQMLRPKGASKQEVANQQIAIQYIFAHPEVVHPFGYIQLADVLWRAGDRERAAFWFYIFQSRTRAWVVEDPDPSRYPAARTSLNEEWGKPINEWIGSDVNAWHDLAARAISYEKKFPFYRGKIDSASDSEWQAALIAERHTYEQGFTHVFTKLLADGGKSSGEQRRANGLYVGPWKNPGQPLLDAWR